MGDGVLGEYELVDTDGGLQHHVQVLSHDDDLRPDVDADARLELRLVVDQPALDRVLELAPDHECVELEVDLDVDDALCLRLDIVKADVRLVRRELGHELPVAVVVADLAVEVRLLR